MKAIHQDIIDTISNTTRKHTPKDLEQILIRDHDLSKEIAGSIIKEMVSLGLLVYTYQFGHTFLEISYQRPVKVSKRIVLVPDRMSYEPGPNEIEIRIKSGASFGMGDHPTTRLALMGIELGLWPLKDGPNRGSTRILDVGTGSGVLLIAALKLGIQTGTGIDTDSSARVESRENLKLNRLSKRADISDHEIEDLEGPFFMMTANLRYPTLINLKSSMMQKLEKHGVLVLSGIKADELTPLKDAYLKENLNSKWEATEADWSCVVFTKTDG